MLRDFLAADLAGARCGSRRTMLARLGRPWCWPAEPMLAEHCCTRLDCSPPPPPPCGSVLLASVTPSGKPSLWELTTEGSRDAEFIGVAAASSRTAARLAARDL